MKQLCEIPSTMLPVYKRNREEHIGRPFEKQRGELPQAWRRKQEVQEVKANCPGCVKRSMLVK